MPWLSLRLLRRLALSVLVVQVQAVGAEERRRAAESVSALEL